MTYSDERGDYIWRYVGGRRVKIYLWQTLAEAMRESGKFPSAEIGSRFRVVGGKSIEVLKGQSLSEAMIASGKFPSMKKETPYDKLMGPEYTGVKGQAAIDKLLEEKRGHVKGAFSRKGIGDIDVLWGDDTFGLQHIINRRNNEGFDGESFVRELPNVIRNGQIRKQSDGRFAITLGDVRAVISPELRDNKLMFLLTAFELG